jgi:GrpB-like predicted nucleotidyltransferase (UPF0157 family)
MERFMHSQPSVTIEPYNPAWPALFAFERLLLAPVLAPWLVGPIEHIGSTAVAGLSAKPVIDIMAAVKDLQSSVASIDALKALGYCYSDYKADVMHWFCKPSALERTHHLHLVPLNCPLWRDRLAFRDRLLTDEATRRGYAELKLALAAKHRNDRDAHTEAKTDFIRSALGAIDINTSNPG